MKIERLQKRIYLGILVLVLIPAIGGVVQFGQVSAFTWQMPFWTGPHQPEALYGEDPSHHRIMILITFLTTITLTLAAGFYLFYTFMALGKHDGALAEDRLLFPVRDPVHGHNRTKKPGETHSPGEPVAPSIPNDFVNNGSGFLIEALPKLASQAAEVAQKANQVMEKSLLALQRCNELTQITQKIATENHRNTLEIRRFLEEIAASRENQGRRYH